MENPMVMGIDVSRWQQKVDWQLLKSKGVEFAIIKATQGDYLTDPMLKNHFKNARDAGMLVGAYHWCDPMSKDDLQAKYFLQAIKDLDLCFIVADVEQHWTDWSEWRNKKITKIIPSQRVSDNAKKVLEYWSGKVKAQIIVYTRATFIDYYAAQASAWLPKYPLWLAHYTHTIKKDSSKAAYTWEKFSLEVPRGGDPKLPRNCSKWVFWQFTGGKYILPGVDSSIDLNLFNGDLAALYKFAGKKLPVSEVQETEEPAPLTLEERIDRLERIAREKGWKFD